MAIIIPTIIAGILYPKPKNMLNAITSINRVIMFVMLPVFSTIATKRSSHIFLLESTPKSISFCFNNFDNDVPNIPKIIIDNHMFMLLGTSEKPIIIINNNYKNYPKYQILLLFFM